MKKVITLMSDSLFIPTGYANQCRQLAKYLSDRGYEVHYLMNAFIGGKLTEVKLDDGQFYKFNMYGSMFGQDYFANSLSQHLKETKSDYLIILLDTFMIYPWFLNIDTSPAKTFFWFPSDGGGGLPRDCENILRKIDCPVAMAKFGQKQLLDYHGIKSEYIPLGIDSKRFYRLPDNQIEELRRNWGLTDKFVIGIVARNQPRKNLDRAIKIMENIKDRIPNAVMLMHMDQFDPAQQVFNLPKLIKNHNLENRFIFTGVRANKGFDWDKMNEVYNLMDIFLLPTSGEGFGIPLVEAMACEIPCLATSYTTTPEIVELNKAGLGIKLSGVEYIPYNEFFNIPSQVYDKMCVNGTMTGTFEVERGICDIEDAGLKIEYLYKNPEIRKLFGQNGRTAVMNNYLFEEHVGKKWEDLFL